MMKTLTPAEIEILRQAFYTQADFLEVEENDLHISNSQYCKALADLQNLFSKLTGLELDL